ncbi:MAG: SusD/RagB family nutrient-binding outer membrane lipoprotein, partial [Bacteroidota bacterium]
MKTKSKIYRLILITCIALTSCKQDFEEINTNPNQPQAISSPSVLLPSVIKNIANDHFEGSFRRGSVTSDHIAFQFVSTFDWAATDAEEYYGWKTNYRELANVYDMIALADKQHLNNYKGVGLILKSWMFQKLTDIFGDIPYSEAVQATANINYPKYSTQGEIYAGIFRDLEEANNLLGTTNEAVLGDILYGGDMLKWKKFANSLRVRAAMRISDRVDPTAVLQQIMSDPNAYPIFESFQDQAALQYIDEFGNQFPRYRAQNSSGVSQSLIDRLKAINDPRIHVFAQPTPTSATGQPANFVYAGVPNGITDAQEAAFNGGPANQSVVGLLWYSVTFDGRVQPDAVQALLMTHSELMFYLAEAAERGFISGNASEYYLKGIASSMEYYASRIPAEFIFPTASTVIAPASYYAQPSVAYSGTKEDKLKKIHLQKWISNYMNGFEAWAEWRRTGYPEIVAGPNSIEGAGGRVPVRFIYPLKEQNLNP